MPALSDRTCVAQKCQERKFDLIFLDLHMPRLEGIEACERIKAGVRNSMTPIICMTSDTDTHTAIDVRAAGMVELLPKPFTDAAFARVVGTWCPVERGVAAAKPPPLAVVSPPNLPVLNRAALAPIDQAFRKKLLCTWEEGFPAVLKGLEVACAAKDHRTMAHLAHGLKGSCAQVGAVAMTALARWIQENTTHATSASLVKLEALFNETVAECGVAFGTHAQPPRRQ